LTHTRERRFKNGKAVKLLLHSKENKAKALAFNQWQSSTKLAITNEKVALTIRTMAAASRICELFTQHCRVKKYLLFWRERCHQREAIALGLQIVSTIAKRKLKTALKLIHKQALRRRQAKKSHKVKAMLMAQLISKLLKTKYHLAFSAISTKYLVISTEAEKQKLK
jgi:hypothetical protein